MDHKSQVQAPSGINLIGDFAGGIPVKLSKEELADLSRINPFLSWLHIAGELSAIVAAIYLCERFWSPLMYLLAIAIIGARQHALLILMHDGVHYRLFRNRRLNDCVSELLAWPHLVAARSYRKNHIAHHRYLNSEKDPDWKRRQGDPAWVFPKPADDLARLLFRDVSGSEKGRRPAYGRGASVPLLANSTATTLSTRLERLNSKHIQRFSPERQPS